MPAWAQIETAEDAARATNAKVVDLVASDNRTCARLRDGTWTCWGEALLGDAGAVASYPRELRYLVPKASGCGVAQAGDVVCWGSWGDGTSRPTRIDAQRGARVIGLADDRLCIGTSDNHVFCRRRKSAWQPLPYDDVVRLGVADNRVGLVRHGHQLTLVQYARDSDVSKARDIGLPARTIVFGADTSYVVTRDYRGVAIPDGGEPQGLPGLPNAVHIGADPSARHVCATDKGGTVRCSGQNQAGQLGTGDTANRASFELVPGIAGAQRVAVGAFHTCALTTTGEVFCWGANDAGQLGVKLAEPEPAAPKGRQKGSFTRANVGESPRASLCTIAKKTAPVQCALSPVQVAVP
ncbi:MAG: RCC1 domain-containing protein [Myxococcota bacterium]|nr:hypothetical protein [Myxococcota bacterium]